MTDSNSADKIAFARSVVEVGQALMMPTGKDGFEKAIRPYFLPSEQAQIMRAYRLAKHGHKDQMREGGGRYFEHPKALALLLVRLGVRDANVICGALLHDVVEDCFILQPEDIEAFFGEVVGRIVQILTKDKQDALTTHQYFDRLSQGGELCWLAKLADRLHNMSTLVDGNGSVDQERYRQKKLAQVGETRLYILPMAVKLTASELYGELGTWFHEQLSAWCEIRESEATMTCL